MDRAWLLTWTTYGTRLPGDERGTVSNVVDWAGRHRRNAPGTAAAAGLRGLVADAASTMRGPPVWLTTDHAPLLLTQFQETAVHRGWFLTAVAVVSNHVHVVVGVRGDPEPDTLLRDFKSYGSRQLNRSFGSPEGGTWWTHGGSTRKLPDDEAVRAATAYVEQQVNPLIVWSVHTPGSGTPGGALRGTAGEPPA